MSCWLCRIIRCCKSQSHFRSSLILFCLLPLVSSDCENKSAEERAKLVYLRSRSHLKVKQQFFNAIYQKVADQVRKQAILTQSSSVFFISGRLTPCHASVLRTGLARNASSRQRKRYHVGCTTIPSRKQMVW